MTDILTYIIEYNYSKAIVVNPCERSKMFVSLSSEADFSSHLAERSVNFTTNLSS